MKILHYALGFPPYRTGGLTKYCTDLMIAQKEQGDDVGLLWPGQIKLINKQIMIKECTRWNDIRSFEIINPLPVPLDEGITNIDAFMTSCNNYSAYRSFLAKYNPDVIHIHTLMGVHREFIDIASELRIKTVFTTHDYFGICPKVTLYRKGTVCYDDCSCGECVNCNESALSLKKIVILQSSLYRKLKNLNIVKKLRQRHRHNFFDRQIDEIPYKSVDKDKALEYATLRKYYITMLEKIDFIHFNSTVTEAVYNKYFTPKKGRVISITHRDIADHRRVKNHKPDMLRITYLGPAKVFKGFQFLMSILDELWNEGESRFELHIYTETSVERPYITHRQNGYTYSQLEGIFDNTDVLVVPSQWMETYGFTVLEATSYGVPVIVSEKVGAKDILPSEYVYTDLKKTLLTILNNGIEYKNTRQLVELLNIEKHTISVKEKIYYGHE